MADIADPDSQQDFAKAIGDALSQFLEAKGWGQSQAAGLHELQDENGKARRSRLNSYFHDGTKGKQKGKRTEVSSQILFLACTKLGFYFDYGGYRLRAVRLGEKQREKAGAQMSFSFQRQFNLTDKAGRVNVKVKRPPGRIELSVSIGAVTRRKITSGVSASVRA
jgi:hypothetical protein